MEISPNALTAGIAVMSAGLTTFTGLMPSLRDVLDDSTSISMRERIDFGRNASSVATLSSGVVFTLVTKSVVPLVYSVGITVLMWGVFELAYRKGIPS